MIAEEFVSKNQTRLQVSTNKQRVVWDEEIEKDNNSFDINIECDNNLYLVKHMCVCVCTLPLRQNILFYLRVRGYSFQNLVTVLALNE